MIYIEKQGIPKRLSRVIINIRKSDAWNTILENDVKAVRGVFDNEFPKNALKEIIVREQKGLCAYCMCRIKMDQHTRIEHFVPLSEDKDKALDYHNMLGVCDGGERVPGTQNHILCCDAHKKDSMLHINPLSKMQMDKIAYKANGIIYTKPMDKVMEKDINEVLLLNGIKKQDGSIIDTATELVKRRRDCYNSARQIMTRLNQKGKCTSSTIKKLIDRLSNEEELEEFVGVKLFYFKKKYNQLVKRGL